MPLKKLSLLLIIYSLSSCYSVRISSRDGIPEGRKTPAPNEEIFYKDKPYHVMDTTFRQGVLNSDFTLNSSEKCPNGFYSVEYKVNASHVLLNLITLGKVKKIKVKYVCIKEQQ